MLTRAYLQRRYEHDGLTYKETAEETAIPRSAVERYARQLGIKARRPGCRARVTVDLDWLAHEHLINRRTLTELAEQAGVSPSHLGRLAKRAGIPTRAHRGDRAVATRR